MELTKTSTRLLLVIACACMALPAAAQIELRHTVQKIERIALDDGTVETRLVEADRVIPGDELRYTVYFRNDGDQPVDPGTIVITDPLPRDTLYIEGSAFGAGTQIQFSADRGNSFASPDELVVVRDGREIPAEAEDYTTIRWQFDPALAPGEQSRVAFNVRLR